MLASSARSLAERCFGSALPSAVAAWSALESRLQCAAGSNDTVRVAAAHTRAADPGALLASPLTSAVVSPAARACGDARTTHATASGRGLGLHPSVYEGLRSARAWSNAQAQRAYSVVSNPSPGKLHDIMRTELLSDKTAKELEEIWIKHHEDSEGTTSNQDRIASVLSGEEYKMFVSRARASPFFVLPLRKPGGGFLSVFLQVQLPYLIMTTVEEYQTQGAGAPPHVMVTHYAEYEDEKDIVLVRGDCLNTHIISTAEARTLVALLHAFYTDPVNHLHIYNFNHDPQSFHFDQILDLLNIPREAPPQTLADASKPPPAE